MGGALDALCMWQQRFRMHLMLPLAVCSLSMAAYVYWSPCPARVASPAGADVIIVVPGGGLEKD
eukprot:1352630-Amphidinium_carterae.1